jgi:hypothetical protein
MPRGALELKLPPNKAKGKTIAGRGGMVWNGGRRFASG